MKRFIDVYNDVVKDRPEQMAFVGEGKYLTYAGLDEAAGRIYAYLKDKGIGREDFVMITLPRNAKTPAAMTGVLKAGAAFVLLEDTYPKDRTEFIFTDCGCKVRLDEKLYDEIQSGYEPLSGNETTDVHDACYAVYTSGSTGTPKGVLHEYGNIDQAMNAYDGSSDDEINTVAIYPAFYFVAGVLDYVMYVSTGRKVYIVPHDIKTDFIGCKKYIEDNNIEEIFLPPSLLKIYKDPAKCLKKINTGSEPANGLSYAGSPRLTNFYAMSESGFIILRCELEKPYDVAPVGTPTLSDIGICLIDEEGKTVEGAGQGELCFKNEFVRGYIGLTDQTNAAWKQDGLFHTNDCVRRDEDGMYYVVGRFDDMIKINGNRVEPVEIETQVKSITGLEQAFAKGFVEPDRSYICLYYLKKEAEDKGIYKDGELVVDRDSLEKLLPDYMIPTYYIGLDAFPLTATGKVARKALKAPDTKDYEREYIAPENDKEKFLCEKMAEVLKLDRVSVLDDFYSMGGDSMRVMMFVTLCNESGVVLKTSDLYECRTPRELAKVISFSDGEEEMIRLDDEARKKIWKLLPAQKTSMAFGWRDDDHSKISIVTLYMLKPEVDPERLAKAAEKVLRAHPGMHVRMTRDDTFMQQFEESYTPDVKIVEIEDKEVEKYGRDITYKFKEEKMYSCNILKSEKANYFHLDIHHALSDATSRKLIMDQIAFAYEDENYEVPRDYYFYMLSERFKNERPEKLLPEGSKVHLIKMDHERKGRDGGAVYRPDIAPIDDNRKGAFFAAALAIAMSKYNECEDVRIKEVFAGRNELYTKNIAGELAISITVDLKITDDKTFEDIMNDVIDQELYQSSHPVNKMGINTQEEAGVRFNYQKNTFDIGEFDRFIEKDMYMAFHETTMQGTFSMNIVETGAKDTVDVVFVYNTSCYERSSIEKLMDIFLEVVNANI